MIKCVCCSKSLIGRQKKFCSRNCKNKHGNNRLQSYRAQQDRGRQRKLQLIEFNGGRCRICGYSRNSSALEFHHVDPTQKEFALDLRSLSNRKWSNVLNEAEKCILVCSNCHKETHNPDFELRPAKKSRAMPGLPVAAAAAPTFC